MSTVRRFSQAPPDKANELFDKLLATSDNAVKTRERLFSGLKEELELLASLQEECLFPVLRRHGMQDLVREATNDNDETSALLSALEAMPRDNSEFLGKVAELRRIFQQHIRDDRKELLPAVLKVLSDEEVEAVAEKMEDQMAVMEEAKRSEARRSREHVETIQRVTEDVADCLRASIEGAQTMMQAVQDVAENSFGTVSQLTHRSADRILPTFGNLDENGQEFIKETTKNVRAIAHFSTALTRCLHDISREALERNQRSLQKNLDGLNALARCRSVTEFAAVQSSFVRDNLEQTVENSRRLGELAIQMADEATRIVTDQVGKSAERVRRIA